MDLKHFGDCYDIVKRVLLDWLSPFGPWVAHPMFTHEVKEAEAIAFSQFVVPLCSTTVLLQQTDRRYYLESYEKYRSVFLDPNTGIRLHRRQAKRSPEFIFAEEVVETAMSHPTGLLLVFDQSVARGREIAAR